MACYAYFSEFLEALLRCQASSCVISEGDFGYSFFRIKGERRIIWDAWGMIESRGVGTFGGLSLLIVASIIIWVSLIMSKSEVTLFIFSRKYVSGVIVERFSWDSSWDRL